MPGNVIITMTFKELKKRISDSSTEQQQQTHSFGKLQNRPLWIWDHEESFYALSFIFFLFTINELFIEDIISP
jgi:hypothetical protein